MSDGVLLYHCESWMTWAGGCASQEIFGVGPRLVHAFASSRGCSNYVAQVWQYLAHIDICIWNL